MTSKLNDVLDTRWRSFLFFLFIYFFFLLIRKKGGIGDSKKYRWRCDVDVIEGVLMTRMN